MNFIALGESVSKLSDNFRLTHNQLVNHSNHNLWCGGKDMESSRHFFDEIFQDKGNNKKEEKEFSSIEELKTKVNDAFHKAGNCFINLL